MSFYKTSIYRGCMTVVIVLLLLTAFCLANLEPGTGPYYLCLFSLVIDVPFLVFLIVKLIRDYCKMKKANQQAAQQPPAAES